jgi:sec-independent protein translocase protein TatA
MQDLASGVIPFYIRNRKSDQSTTGEAMLEDLSPAKILIVVLIFVVFFGAKKIPEIAQGLGKGMREFRKATREIADGGDDKSSPSGSAGAQSVTIPCSYCSTPVTRDAKFCPSCGQSLEPKKCSRCAALNELGNKFCSDCGDRL